MQEAAHDGRGAVEIWGREFSEIHFGYTRFFFFFFFFFFFLNKVDIGFKDYTDIREYW